MLCLIFIPGLQSASPQGASVSLSPPPALAVLSVFHNPQNEQLPRSGLLLSGVLEGCQPPDLTRVPIPGQPLGDQGKGEHSSVGLLWLLGSRMGRLPNPERPEGYSQKPRGVFPQPPALCRLTTEEQGSLSTQMPLSPPAEASCQPTQPCQQSQLIAGQQQSTKRERVRSRDNSHQSHRGHLAGGDRLWGGRSLCFISPHIPGD